MARSKVAILLKYDFFSTANNSGLSKAERYDLLEGLAVYDREGKIPSFSNQVQTVIFALHINSLGKSCNTLRLDCDHVTSFFQAKHVFYAV